jgi:glucoamylase
VGTALGDSSPLWFTLSHGIITEVFWPRQDIGGIRDFGFVVTDGSEFFSEERRDTVHVVETLGDGIPAWRMINTCKQGRYRITKTIVSDPERAALLQQVTFEALQGSIGDYRLYALLAPHLNNAGSQNTAWVDRFAGHDLLAAIHSCAALVALSSCGWRRATAGFVGVSDGWQDLHEHGQLTWDYDFARDGNVALTGEIDLAACDGKFFTVLGFGANVSEATAVAIAAHDQGFESICRDYVDMWEQWQDRVSHPGKKSGTPDLCRLSAAVLRVHESMDYPGAIVASLSIPWGQRRGDHSASGYHVVWPRDLCESAGGLIALDAAEAGLRIFDFLRRSQNEDGRWPQNIWLNGKANWGGFQLDEVALPVLLADLAMRQKVLARADYSVLWPMVRRAASFMVCNGPHTDQDRWEQNGGYNCFTVASYVAALVVAAEYAESETEVHVARYLRETADAWHDEIDAWLWVSGTPLAAQAGVGGYYIWSVPTGDDGLAAPLTTQVFIPNRAEFYQKPCIDVVSPDALALVRFGLRAADDPRILDTIAVVDRELKVDTPRGRSWHRYSFDGYGEKDDGTWFDDQSGVGRAWPVLTGERGHYEVAAGHYDAAEALLHAIEGFASEGGMIPEQVWDSDDIPDREMFCGRPTGSAMPLAWAHAEYAKLRRSIDDRRVFDVPEAARQRYVGNRQVAAHAIWRLDYQRPSIRRGKLLRIEVLAPATLVWTSDGWATRHEDEMQQSGLQTWYFDIATDGLAPGPRLEFTLHWPQAERWEGRNFVVAVRDE